MAEAATLTKELRDLSAQQAKPLWPGLALVPVPVDHPLSFPDSKNDELIYWTN